MKKITIKVSDELAAEFNQTVKRRCTTQKKAFEVMLRDWLAPGVPDCRGCVRPEPSLWERIFGSRGND